MKSIGIALLIIVLTASAKTWTRWLGMPVTAERKVVWYGPDADAFKLLVDEYYDIGLQSRNDIQDADGILVFKRRKKGE